MKKIISFLLLLFLFPCYVTAHELSIKLGASFAEPLDIDYKTEIVKENGEYLVNPFSGSYHSDADLLVPAITVDFYYYLHQNFHIGIGLNSELFRHTEGLYGNISYFTPYISIKPNIDIKECRLFALAKLGTTLISHENPYNLSIDTKQRISYSVGFGVEYQNFIFEFACNILHWKSDTHGQDSYTSGGGSGIADDYSYQDIIHHSYTFNIGYKFNIFNRN